MRVNKTENPFENAVPHIFNSKFGSLLEPGLRFRITSLRIWIKLSLNADPDPAFILMRSRVLLLVNVGYESVITSLHTYPPSLHSEPPHFHCERPRLRFEPLYPLNFDFNADPDPAFFSPMLFRIQLAKLMQIRIRNPG
jgi:hypothetical protein